jgi:hypothetical protein
MKILSKIVLLVAFISAAGITAKVSASPACVCNLQWNASSGTDVAGYAVYYGASGSSVTNRLDAGSALSATVKGLVASSSYFFYVVAYNPLQQESSPSNLLLYTAPAMSSLRLSQTNGVMNLWFHVAPGAACHVEYTASLSPATWTVLSTASADTNGLVVINDPDVSEASRFYRAVIP